MPTFARRIIVPVLLVAALLAPASAFATPPVNDDPGTRLPIAPYGETLDWFTYDATMEPGYFNWGDIGNWGWSMWYSWKAPIAGKVQIDLCQTAPFGDEWYIAAWDSVEGPSPLAYNVAAKDGCPDATMPQGRFDAVAGTEYRLGIGAKLPKTTFAKLRVLYLPQVDAAPKITGSTAIGQTLRANAPTWKTAASGHTLSAPTWERCATGGGSCTTIATADTYVVQPADLGMQLRMRYTATNVVGTVETSSALTTPIAVSPSDLDGDGIPDELVSALGIPAGAEGFVILCARFALCKDNKDQSPIFTKWNSMSVIDGALLDALLGSAQSDLLIAGGKSKTCDGKGGDDVCVGKSGADTCIAYIGDDFCLGNRGNDTCLSKAGNDVCYGGEGADVCMSRPMVVAGVVVRPPVPKVECFGANGTDACLVNVTVRPAAPGFPRLPDVTCSGGPANDTCKAAAAKLASALKIKTAGVMRMKCAGGTGNDSCGVTKSPANQVLGTIAAKCAGGPGNDLCIAAGAANFAAGLFTALRSVMNCAGGTGNDTLWTLNGNGGDTIDGGGQAGDACVADMTDIVKRCARTVRVDLPKDEIDKLNGSLAALQALADKSKATVNGTTVEAEQLQLVLQAINDVRANLEAIQQSQADSLRALARAV